MTDTKPTLEVVGLNRFVSKLGRFDRDLADRLKRVNLELAQVVAAVAKTTAPRRTGRLAQSVRAGSTKRSGVVRAGRARVPYAKPIHFGWPTRPNPAKRWWGGPISPQPWMYEALDSRREEVLAAYVLNVEHVLDGIARSTDGAAAGEDGR